MVLSELGASAASATCRSKYAALFTQLPSPVRRTTVMHCFVMARCGRGELVAQVASETAAMAIATYQFVSRA
jgi:hypothetical protein